jgi:DNA-binding NarL/FixJ family response regulator
MNKKISVLLVDDHLIARNGVKLMLSKEERIHIGGEAENISSALRLARENEFDIAIIDISLQEENGLELLRFLRAEKPKLQVLMLSMYAEEVYAVRALKLGASGYLSKNVDAGTFIKAVYKIAEGRRYISPELADKLVDIVSGEELTTVETLSNREIEILKLIASGKSLVHIAEKLHLSSSTVTTYRRRILEKTGLSSNADLINYVRETGLLH